LYESELLKLDLKCFGLARDIIPWRPLAFPLEFHFIRAM